MWTLALLAAVRAQEGVAGFDYRTILGGIIGSSPVACVLLWQLIVEQKDNRELRKEIHDLNEQMHQRAERFAPVLVDATRALEEVQKGMAAAINRNDRSDGGVAVDDAARRLEAVVRDLQRQRR